LRRDIHDLDDDDPERNASRHEYNLSYGEIS
jgi:hypothetical protein